MVVGLITRPSVIFESASLGGFFSTNNSKMGFLSAVLLVSLLSWNAQCFPLQESSHGNGVSNGKSHQQLHYGSSHTGPFQYSSVPIKETEQYLSSEAHYSPTQMSSTGGAWFSPDDSTSTLSSPPKYDAGILPPVYLPGEILHYKEVSDHGNADRETEEHITVPPPYEQQRYQAGDLIHYLSISEDGSHEMETEDVPRLPYALLQPVRASHNSLRNENLDSPVLDAYSFYRTGQVPPGILSKFHSMYETGGDDWDEVHYERPSSPYDPQKYFNWLWR
ncbi:uncharacterized protein LOC128765161 [Synchiropus splendidus]|uniref:uncharacterized protein LOC128765161 n=1 Tax=Synchiropus splendidus TaxID=270530 RepID=UPI00237DDFB9|nr:uncharacterized protein LOC128765161 [Synchiropus splendidus]